MAWNITATFCCNRYLHETCLKKITEKSIICPDCGKQIISSEYFIILTEFFFKLIILTSMQIKVSF